MKGVLIRAYRPLSVLQLLGRSVARRFAVRLSRKLSLSSGIVGEVSVVVAFQNQIGLVHVSEASVVGLPTPLTSQAIRTTPLPSAVDTSAASVHSTRVNTRPGSATKVAMS